MIGTPFLMIMYFLFGLVAGILLSILDNIHKELAIIEQRRVLLDQHSEEQDPEQRLKIAVKYASMGGDTDLLYADLDLVMFIREVGF